MIYQYVWMIHIHRIANNIICIFECPTAFGNEQHAWRVSSLPLIIDDGSYVITGRAGTGGDNMGFQLTIMQISNTYGGRPMLRLAQSIYGGNFLAQLMPSTPYWCGGGWRRAAPAGYWVRGRGEGAKGEGGGGREREPYYLQFGVPRVHFWYFFWSLCLAALCFVCAAVSSFLCKFLLWCSYPSSPFKKHTSFFLIFLLFMQTPLLTSSGFLFASFFSALCAEVCDYGEIQLWGASLCPCSSLLFIFCFIVIGLFAEAFIYLSFMSFLRLYYFECFFFIYWWWS